MIIDKETLTRELFTEILPLAQKAWNEGTRVKGKSCAYYGERDFDIEPDVDAYLRLAEAGLLIVITLRDHGVLKGYVAGFLYRSLHHKQIPCGMGDSIYVERAYRPHVDALADRFEKEFMKLGAKIIGWPIHIKGSVYKVLESRGYVGDDIVMEKRLCA